MGNPRPIEAARCADLRGSWPALVRAARRAREVAAQTGTACVVMQDGELRHVYPEAPTPACGVQDPDTATHGALP